MNMSSQRIVVITGLSGSGKTIFLRALEDAGFYCVDNIPVKLIPSLVDLSDRTQEIRQLGLGIDIRDRNIHEDFAKIETLLRRSTRGFELVFLEADDETIARRFKETRRPHPLARGVTGLKEAVALERKELHLLRESADRIVDTTALTPHQLRENALTLYGDTTEAHGMSVRLVSFGFKYGPPAEADVVMDVRFLPNPHFVPALKPMSGLEFPVAEFVLGKDVTRRFLRRFSSLLRFLLPLYIREGKTSLTVAIGCTGGRHRSPAIVEKLRKSLTPTKGISLSVLHRDIDEETPGEG